MSTEWRCGISLKIKGGDIEIASEEIASFFRMNHDKELMPIITSVYKKNKKGIKEFKCWGNIRKKMFLFDYTLNKKGCIKLCSALNAPKQHKDDFLRVIGAIKD